MAWVIVLLALICSFKKAITPISVNFHGKNLRNTTFFAQSQTFQVCSFATKLVLLAFFSWKSTALGVIAFFLCLLLNQGFVVNVAKYYVFCSDTDHLGVLLWKSLVFIPVFLINRPKSTKFSYLPHQSLLFYVFWLVEFVIKLVFFGVCSFATKLVFLAFFSWKSTALGVIAFFMSFCLVWGFVVNVAKYYVFWSDIYHLGMLLWKSLVFIPVFLLQALKIN